jgi:toxin ParE1/3/4
LRLVWTENALDDRMGIFDYIAEDNFAAAVRIDDRIERHTGQLEQWAETGRNGRVEGTRELVIADTPYVVVYSIAGEQVVVWRVLHGAMQWPPVSAPENADGSE